MSNFTNVTSTHKILCWHLTNQCTRSCDFCLSRSSPLNKIYEKDYAAIIKRIKSLGFEKISYSGGEPFLVPNFDKIVAMGKQLSIEQIATTNGDLLLHYIDEPFLRDFQYIKLSFYGIKETHDEIVGTGRYNDLMNTAMHLREQGLKIGINYMLTRHSLPGLQHFLDQISSFNPHNLLIQSYIPTGDKKIDQKYQIDKDVDLSFLSRYSRYFEYGIKYFDYAIKDGFQIILDDNMEVYFPNGFGQKNFRYGNLFDDCRYAASFGKIYLDELVRMTFENRNHSNTIKIY